MISKIDHLVLTTANADACIAFYEKLGFRAQQTDGRLALFAGDFKINIHVKGHELEPKARHVQPGSADLCFEVSQDLAMCRAILREKGLALELDDVPRVGVHGKMRSLYLRDPDENLIELCHYE
ncbi:MAG: VOC family protein [Ruthenibacterium sp.]